jgi:hypothetical protein
MEMSSDKLKVNVINILKKLNWVANYFPEQLAYKFIISFNIL